MRPGTCYLKWTILMSFLDLHLQVHHLLLHHVIFVYVSPACITPGRRLQQRFLGRTGISHQFHAHTHNDLGLAFTKDACSTSENTNILRCLAKLRAMGLSKVCGWWAFCTPIYEEVLLMILMCFKDFKNATSTMHCQTVEGLVACTCFS